MLQGMVGHYQVLALRGTGGMGAVHKGLDTRLNRPVALKVINPRHIQDPDAVTRLRREALAAASLDHPYICKVYELLEDGQQTVLVMEYLEGETLAERLARGPLPLGDTLRSAAEVAEALVEAHQKGVVHRDIKPSNIMMTAHGHVMVMDFGIAGFVSSQADSGLEATTTTALGRVGTPRYMAPEQVTSGVADTRSDLFSLGVVMYEALTGRLPFSGDSGMEYVNALARQTPRPLAELDPRVPHAVERVVMRCLERDPHRRFQSAVDLHATLTDLSEDTANGLLKASRPARVWRRRPFGMAAAVGAVALAAWLTVLYVWLPRAPAIEPGRYLQLTTSGGEHDSRVSPDGHWISYLSDADGGSIIRHGPLADPRTPQNQIVTATPGTIVSHAWSPDSSEIAYLRAVGDVLYLEKIPRTGSPEPRTCWTLTGLAPAHLVRWIDAGIYLESRRGLLRVDAGTGQSNAVELPAEAHPERARDFDIDPDGRHLVFSSSSGAIYRDIWHFDLRSTKLIRLTRDQHANKHPMWLGPGGRFLVFQSNRDGQTDLWQMDSLTRETRRLTTGRGDEVPNDAAADGSILTYELSDDTSRLYRAAGWGAEPVALTQENVIDTWPSVARDSAALVFQRSGAVRKLGWEFLDTEIYLMPGGSEGTNARLVARGYAPAISPDGRWLAFLRQDPGQAQRTELWLRTPQKQETLLSGHFDNPGVWGASAPAPFEQTAVNVAWSPDGSRIYFVESDPEPGTMTRLVAYETGTERKSVMFEGGGPLHDVRPSRDGREVAFVRQRPDTDGRRQFEIVVVETATGRERIRHRGSLDRPQSVRLLGWRNGDRALVLLKLSRNTDQTQQTAVLAIREDGRALRVGAALDRAWASTARLDPAGGHLYVLTRGERFNTLLAMPAEGGPWKEVLTTGSGQVVLEGMAFTASGDAVFARHERTLDVHGVWFNLRR